MVRQTTRPPLRVQYRGTHGLLVDSVREDGEARLGVETRPENADADADAVAVAVSAVVASGPSLQGQGRGALLLCQQLSREQVDGRSWQEWDAVAGFPVEARRSSRASKAPSREVCRRPWRFNAVCASSLCVRGRCSTAETRGSRRARPRVRRNAAPLSATASRGRRSPGVSSAELSWGDVLLLENGTKDGKRPVPLTQAGGQNRPVPYN